MLNFSDGKHLIIEAKLSSDDFKKSQFINHFNGSKKEFGEENIWLLFLSSDEVIPPELNEFKKKHPELKERIGFLSWKSLLTLLDKYKALEKYGTILKSSDFLLFRSRDLTI